MRAALLLLALVPATAAQAVPAAAQAGTTRTGGISAYVVIVQPPLATVGTKTLQFGVITPGSVKILQPRDAQAGQLRISGMRNRRWANIAMTLPAALDRIGGGATLPLSFNGEYAGLCEAPTGGACDEDSYVTWNPTLENPYQDTPSNFRKRGRSNRQTYALDEMIIYVGGEARPAAGQVAGNYQGTITITITTN